MKKKTVVRKISWKEYVTVLWILEHRKQYEEGEICDLSMFPQEQLEILVVDGGSNDRTREIACQYGAKIIDNPKKLPK